MTMPPDVDLTWRRIESWLSANAPAAAALLRPAATPSEIAAAEVALGRPLPPDFLASVRRHDGQVDTIELFDGWKLLSLAGIVDYWQMLDGLLQAGTFDTGESIETRGSVQPVWWTSAWIPALVNVSGDVLSLDVEPTQGGNVGQVVLFRHDDPRRDVVATSFAAWLTELAEDLEAGSYDVTLDGDAVRRKT
jgi:cell wall assembly regulator SMI1